MPLDGQPSVGKQWGLSGNDPGMGGGIFTYPLSCTPLIALANPSELGTNDLPNDAVITTTYNTSCVIDSTRTGYNGAYRVILIGNV